MSNLNKFLTHFKAGDTIYKKGEKQGNLYIINSGKIQVRQDDNGEVLVALSKGDFFGEESLNADQDAFYTIEVIEDVAVVKIPYTFLTDMMKQSTEISLKILKKLSEKHVKIEDALVSLWQNSKTTDEKVKKREEKSDERPAGRITPDIKAFLVIQRSNRVVQLTKTVTFLGRRDYTSGFVPDVDLTEEDEEKYISRKHAQIMFKGGKFYMAEEPGSINGTFLNGNKLNTGVKYELHNGDEMTLCHLNIVFKV